jgi:hypothetical protein
MAGKCLGETTKESDNFVDVGKRDFKEMGEEVKKEDLGRREIKGRKRG